MQIFFFQTLNHRVWL